MHPIRKQACHSLGPVRCATSRLSCVAATLSSMLSGHLLPLSHCLRSSPRTRSLHQSPHVRPMRAALLADPPGRVLAQVRVVTTEGMSVLAYGLLGVPHDGRYCLASRR